MITDLLSRIFAFDEHSPLLFTQFYFWAFFAVVLLCMSFLGRRVLLRNAFLCFVSLFFYYKTSGIFVLILVFATVVNFLFGKSTERCQSAGGRRLRLTVGIIVNLAVLAYFKYAYFLTAMVNDILGTDFEVVDYFAMVGNVLYGDELFRVDAILLPVGISFYTFQCISYLMDIYRRRIKAVANLLDFGFYVSFFPQLVAGPIVRANEFVEQLYRPYHLSRRHFGLAVFWILNGLAKKIILSDYIAVNFVDRVFINPTMYGGFENLSALFGYSLQVYADFSGYTDIAIGVAMILGFYLPVNFNSPYKAPNAGNFWKRWHMSLSRWLQDYLYIPMGGNRNSTVGTYIVIVTIAVAAAVLSGSIWIAIIVMAVAAICAIVMLAAPSKRRAITTNINAMNTMLLGGLWHGASWNFMIWGGLNGLGCVVFKVWRPMGVHVRSLVMLLCFGACCGLEYLTEQPVFIIGEVWLGILAAACIVRSLYNLVRLPWTLAWLEHAWAVLQTFVFITFTRLFFRSGSNLDPAEANETAWTTAKDMVTQIGTEWHLHQIPLILIEYRDIYILIVLGMLIHWLPDRLKRRYRVVFASLPLPVMLLAIVVVVFVVYQFVTADLQKFIYFQF